MQAFCVFITFVIFSSTTKFYMAALFLLGSIGFWILLAVAFMIAIAFLESESIGIHYVFPITILIVGYSNYEVFSNLGNQFLDNPWYFIGMFFAYIVIGIIWSYIKWFIYLKDFIAYKVEFSLSVYESEISIKGNSGKIIYWMMYWPFSLVWTFIDQPVKKMFTRIFNMLKKTYEKIAANATKGIEIKK